MSIKAEKWAWAQPLPTSEKMVLLKLAHHADPQTGEAYPGVKNIADATALSERQVQRYLKGFVERGVLTIVDNKDGGRGRTRTYQFAFVKGDMDHIDEAQNDDIDDTVLDNERVTPEATKGDTRDAEINSQRVTSDEIKGDIPGVKGDTFTRADPEQPVKNSQKEQPVAKPMPRHGKAQTLVATLYEDVLGIGSPTGYKAVVGQAELLAKAGCTPDELRQIAEWLLADPYWAPKGINMGLILKKRDDWRSVHCVQPGSIRVMRGGNDSRPGYIPELGFNPNDGMDSMQMARWAMWQEEQERKARVS